MLWKMKDRECLLEIIRVVLSLEDTECLIISELPFRANILSATPSVLTPPGLLAHRDSETSEISTDQV